MKKIRKIIKPFIAVALCLVLVVTSFAAGIASKNTANHGELQGTLTQSNDSFIATVSITKGSSNAFVCNTISLDRFGVEISRFTENSAYGGTYLRSVSAPRFTSDTEPNMAYGAHEVRCNANGCSDVVYTSIKANLP